VPTDEYAHEADSILRVIMSFTSESELRLYIHKTFNEWLEMDCEIEHFAVASRGIWDWFHKKLEYEQTSLSEAKSCRLLKEVFGL
jgi:hypothetical protein